MKILFPLLFLVCFLSQTAFPNDQLEEYVEVKQGDTLQKISSRYYGTTRKWHKLFLNNRDVLGSPNELVSGTRIRLLSRSNTENKRSDFVQSYSVPKVPLVLLKLNENNLSKEKRSKKQLIPSPSQFVQSTEVSASERPIPDSLQFSAIEQPELVDIEYENQVFKKTEESNVANSIGSVPAEQGLERFSFQL